MIILFEFEIVLKKNYRYKLNLKNYFTQFPVRAL